MLGQRYAEIRATWHEVWRGRGYWTYDWLGSPRLPVALPRDHVGDKPGLKDYPWPLKYVGDIPYSDAAEYVRRDVCLGLPMPYYKLLAFLRQRLMGITARLIVTAMIWGLAYVPDWETPSWRHLGRRRK